MNWALTAKVDGIVVGATFPKIIQYCSKKAGKNLSIFSPGVGTQGGSANEVISAGTNYLIVGRTILMQKILYKRVAKNYSYKVLESNLCAFVKTVFALSNVVFSIDVL